MSTLLLPGRLPEHDNLRLRDLANHIRHLDEKDPGISIADLPNCEDILEELAQLDVQCLRDLLAADTLMIALFGADPRCAKAAETLRGKAQRFIERFPQLLQTGWVLVDGSIFQLMEEMRQNEKAREVLSRIKLESSSTGK